MTRRITAPELDEMLVRITGAVAKLSPQERDSLRAEMPADIMASADQAHAAHAEAVELVERAENRRIEYVPQTSVDEWIRIGALDVVIQWITGRGRTCMHSPSHRRPEPVFAAAWKPNLVVCTQCLHLLGVTGVADKTCDCCGRVCEGLDADDPIYTGTVFIGELAYEFGACGDCRPSLNEGVA